MWARYKRSFAGMQLFIAAITLSVLILSQRAFAAGVFFLTMQLGALMGAAWAARLERLFAARSRQTPPEHGR